MASTPQSGEPSPPVKVSPHRDTAVGNTAEHESAEHASAQRPRLQHSRAGRHAPSVILFACTTLVMLGADLLSKKLAFERVAAHPVILSWQDNHDAAVIPYHEAVVLIPHVLSLRLTTNTGAVFGLGKGAQMVFIAVSVLAVGVIFRVFWQSNARAWVLHVSLGLILAGAIGNLYDRIRFNAVRDLLWLFPTTDLWPWIFNVADAALLIGVGLMLVVMWRNDKQTPSGQTAPD